MRTLLVFLLLVSNLSTTAQYTYFNVITGVVQDSLSDTFFNIEVVADTIYTYGGQGDFENGIRLQLTKWSFEGERFQSQEYLLPFNTTYFEITNSFKIDQENQFFYLTCGGADSIVSGYAGKIDLNLDTIWTKRYDH